MQLVCDFFKRLYKYLSRKWFGFEKLFLGIKTSDTSHNGACFIWMIIKFSPYPLYTFLDQGGSHSLPIHTLLIPPVRLPLQTGSQPHPHPHPYLYWHWNVTWGNFNYNSLPWYHISTKSVPYCYWTGCPWPKHRGSVKCDFKFLWLPIFLRTRYRMSMWCIQELQSCWYLVLLYLLMVAGGGFMGSRIDNTEAEKGDKTKIWVRKRFISKTHRNNPK